MLTKRKTPTRPIPIYFTGPNCGGTGWIMFDVDVPKARWAEELTTLGRSDDPQSCGNNYPAWTRTREDDIAFPFIEKEQARLVTVNTIVSEHYDNRNPLAARLTERFYLGYNWGWLRWEKTGPVSSDLLQRCPYVSLSEYPSGGAKLADDRLSHMDKYSTREWRTYRANRLALKDE
jgi:hypothetical protein